MMRSTQQLRQKGAALITAMLTVTLVATLAAAAVWQQWQATEVEAAERTRTQMNWILNGALDWARLILREDAKAGSVDHLSEPWAVPLEEARLSTFLAVDKNNADLELQAFLSGQISDQQARLNITNLLDGGKISESGLRSFARLFKVLNLPPAHLDILAHNLRDASQPLPADNANAAQNQPVTGLLMPQRVEQLDWLGVPASTVRALRPFVSLLPVSTSVNVNTASAEVLYAAMPGLDMGEARRMVNQRASQHFATVGEAFQASKLPPQMQDPQWLSVESHFFTIRGRLRWGETTVQEVTLVQRQGNDVRVLWRQREAVRASAPGTLISLQ